MQWGSFKSWLERHGHHSRHITLASAIESIEEKFNNLMNMAEFTQILDLYDQYQREDNGPMKKYWNSYLQMVSLMLSLIRATKEGNWSLHLECTKQMIPWFFAYDHINYARYLPVYLIHMVTLPDTHPDAHMMLENGDFGVQRTSKHGFAQVPVDQTIEQTLNRSTKTKGGIIGFSLKKSAVQRWLLTTHSRAGFVDQCRMMTANTKQEDNRLHKETARIQRDEKDVNKVIEVIGNWNDPFEESEELFSISSGRMANKKIKEDLITAKDKGTNCLTKFVQERLLSASTGFHDTLTKLKLGTFTDLQKKTPLTKEGKTVVLKADRNLFARLLVVGQSRKMNLQELLVHELGPLPWSLASFDGSLAKTNKAALSKLIEDGVESLQHMPQQSSAVVVDAMAFLQMLCKVPEKFSDLAEMVLKRMIIIAGEATRLDFVGDRYPDVSIKNIEREKRSSAGQLTVNITSPLQLCPRQWKKFMSSGSNKEGLMIFLANEWTNQRYVPNIGNRTLYITHGEACTRLEVTEGRITSTAALELFSTHEEADTRMILHAHHASTHGYQRVTIMSSDTDVEVLACHHQINIPAQITLVSGTRSRQRLISIPQICEKLGPSMCRVLPSSLHALTGCDSVSAFAGKGKKKAMELVKDDERARCSVEVLGDCVPLSETDIANLEETVCCLYNDNECSSVNDARYRIFCRGKNVQSHQLPPSSAALKYHLMRANYQAYIWKHALDAEMDVSPENQGWEIRDGLLEIVWTDMLPAPEAVMELVCCGCNGSCQTRRCSCVKGGLPCTDACACNDECVNMVKDTFENDGDEEDESDVEDDLY